ncbi:MAG: hypothetical protein QF738_06600 [Rhodospirillales bacterium]|nr:hypothetical protein [Rhodospirillales bacterium]
MLKSLANGFTRVKESAKHSISFKIGEVNGTNVFALMIQKYVINNEPIDSVMKWGAETVDKVLDG